MWFLLNKSVSLNRFFFIVSQIFILISYAGFMILPVGQVNHPGHSTVFVKWFLCNGSS